MMNDFNDKQIEISKQQPLLPPSSDTNFVYRIIGDSITQIVKSINEIDTPTKITDRLNAIYQAGSSLRFVSTEKSTFRNNLLLIDSLLPIIVSDLILRFYEGRSSSVFELTNVLEQDNSQEFDQSSDHQFYINKIKRFLSAIALGMIPSEVWTGRNDATGGRLVVKEDGDFIYHKNEFENYLLNNSKLEIACSSKHGFGLIYSENNEYFMNLNLQIKFIK